MRFLIDEDVPLALLDALKVAGHDAIRVNRSAPDIAVATHAKRDGRILITLDKDFTNPAMYPPAEFTIIHLRIHPPHALATIEAVQRLLHTVPPDQLTGLFILHRAGHIHVGP